MFCISLRLRNKRSNMAVSESNAIDHGSIGEAALQTEVDFVPRPCTHENTGIMAILMGYDQAIDEGSSILVALDRNSHIYSGSSTSAIHRVN